MPKDDLVEMDGAVVEALGGGQYQIKLETKIDGRDTIVRAQLSGRLKRNHIRVLPGDRVRVSVSPYDMTHGLISYRHK